MKGRGLFLDRDGTLVHPRHYPSRPEELVLYDDLGPRLHNLQTAGFQPVVITNQGGLAHGFFTEADLGRMHAYLADELARSQVQLAGIFYCPHHPDGVVPGLATVCRCRKPEPGLLLKAAEELRLDLGRSWFVGDILDDVEAGNRAGCRTILVDIGTESRPTAAIRRPHYVARSTVHALEIIAAVEGLGPPVDLSYQPLGWEARGAMLASTNGEQVAGGEQLVSNNGAAVTGARRSGGAHVAGS